MMIAIFTTWKASLDHYQNYHHPPIHWHAWSAHPQNCRRSFVTTALARKAGALMLEGSHAIQRAGAGGDGEKYAVDL
jgi:hypothetical protein